MEFQTRTTTAWSGASWSNQGVQYALELADGTDFTDYYLPSLGGLTDELRGRSSGFAIPNGATILGIQVSVRRRSYADLDTGSGNRRYVIDKSIFVTSPDVPISGQQNRADLYSHWPASTYVSSGSPPNWGSAVYGGSGDLWGRANGDWTPSRINNVFEVSLVAEAIDDNLGDNLAEVDNIQTTIYYNPSPNNNIPLFIQGYIKSSGNIPLSITGHSPISGNIPLFIQGHSTSSGSIPLFIMSGASFTSGIPLYILGNSPISGNIPLYICGNSSSSGNIPLYIQGSLNSNGFIPLFLEVNEIERASGNFPLYIYGSTPGSSGLFNSIPLYLQSTNFPGSIPLYLLGREYDNKTKTIPLYIQGAIHHIQGSIPLYVVGPSGTTGGIPLYINGLSTSLFYDPSYQPGGLNSVGTIPLFIERAFGASIPLYIGASRDSGNIPLYILGAYGINSGVPLSMTTHALLQNSINLFTRGF